jgi:hypothetical protein
MNLSTVLSAIPLGLREPLIKEYQSIVHNYLHRKWQPAELSGGLFCEIVFTILDGFAAGGAYAATPFKPANFVDACKQLENRIGAPRSFKIMIPRILPALYEVRNNRNVGHVGGDVDPNQMDAAAVLSNSSWIMAELVRYFHNTDVDSATAIVTDLVEKKIPIVWSSGNIKRVLARLSRPDEVLVLLAASSGAQTHGDLVKWVEEKDIARFDRVLANLHRGRFIEWHRATKIVELMPPGLERAEKIIAETGAV